ncbi:MAG TPA: ABC transporter permease, partial [Ardenticatenaceae bacterium]|nr:ABC transporter permease [Ardenticatenaceae bacterium]
GGYAGHLDQAERERLRAQPLWRVRLRLLWRSLRSNWRLFAENKIGLVGLAIILLFVLMAIAYPILMGRVWDPRIYNPITGVAYDDMMQGLSFPSPPSSRHLLGTDPLGRDILSQLMYSTASEFTLGLTAALVTVIIATIIGAASAYFGGVVDTIFMRIADLVIMLPAISILIVLGALIELNLFQLAIVLGLLSGFGGTTIILKSQALTVKVRAYIEAARIAGGGHGHIIFRHIIPNLLPLSFLYMMFSVTGAIFSEAVLSYFGLLNIRMSWGLMIHTAQTAGYLLNFQTWWLIVPAGLAITLLCSAFYLVGRALDEVVNPRLRQR